MPRHLRGGSFHFNFDSIRYDTFAWEKQFSLPNAHEHTVRKKKRRVEEGGRVRANKKSRLKAPTIFQRRRFTIIFFLFFFLISIEENHPRAILLLQNSVMSAIISMHLSPIALRTQHAQYFALLLFFSLVRTRCLLLKNHRIWKSLRGKRMKGWEWWCAYGVVESQSTKNEYYTQWTRLRSISFWLYSSSPSTIRLPLRTLSQGILFSFSLHFHHQRCRHYFISSLKSQPVEVRTPNSIPHNNSQWR